jgi:hypothetical protein
MPSKRILNELKYENEKETIIDDAPARRSGAGSMVPKQLGRMGRFVAIGALV